MTPGKIAALVCVGLLAHAPLLARPRVAAVLSSGLGPYEKAYAGFLEAMGEPVEKHVLNGEDTVRVDADVIVTFGGKAALAAYPADAHLIYGLAVGTFLDGRARRGQTAKISLLPEPRTLLQRFKSLQPGMRRFAMVWTTEYFGDYYRELMVAGKGMGIEVVPFRIAADGLKGRLAEIDGKADALWVAPDPQLLSEATFAIFKGYCLAKGVPFYVPLDGFLEKGAAAAIFIDYAEVGRSMSAAAKKVLKGETIPRRIHPAKCVLSLSRSSMARYGQAPGDEALKAADEVNP